MLGRHTTKITLAAVTIIYLIDRQVTKNFEEFKRVHKNNIVFLYYQKKF